MQRFNNKCLCIECIYIYIYIYIYIWNWQILHDKIVCCKKVQNLKGGYNSCGLCGEEKLWNNVSTNILKKNYWIEEMNLYPNIGLMIRVFTNGSENQGSIRGRVKPKTQKMVLNATLLNTQHYKIRTKGKVEQSREWSSSLFNTKV